MNKNREPANRLFGEELMQTSLRFLVHRSFSTVINRMEEASVKLKNGLNLHYVTSAPTSPSKVQLFKDSVCLSNTESSHNSNSWWRQSCTGVLIT
jgi:hypothetical protein